MRVALFLWLLGLDASSASGAAAGEHRPRSNEGRTLQVIRVPGSADVLAKLVEDAFHPDDVRVWVVGPQSLAVWAQPAGHADVRALHVRQEDGKKDARPSPNEGAAVLPVPEGIDGRELVRMLKSLFGEPQRGGPFLDLDRARNAIVIRGSAEHLKDLKEALRVIAPLTPSSPPPVPVIDGKPAADVADGSESRAKEVNEAAGVLVRAEKTRHVRIIELGKDSAATLAEVLKRLMAEVRPNPVKVLIGKDGGGLPKEVRPDMLVANKNAVKASEAPVTLTAVGNRLVIATEDSEAMAVISELARIAGPPPWRQPDFTIVRLNRRIADDVARLIDVAVNDKQKTTRNERIHIVADPATNSLLIRASPLDMLTIRSMIETLDVGGVYPSP